MARDEAYRKAEETIEAAQRTGLTKLDLSGTSASNTPKLTELPESLARLTLLQELHLGNNQLAVLPEWLGSLTQLRWLNLDNNQLTVLPECLGHLTHLDHLDLPGNQFTALPESLAHLTQLRWLHLGNNQLTALPEWLGSLTQLRWLHLGNNQLTVLPESIGRLAHLEHLDLRDNQLSTLPESLGQLTQLQMLYFINNRLTALSESLLRLTQLRALFLHGNPALGLPDEVFGPTSDDVWDRGQKPKPPAEILDSYFRIQGNLGRPLAECKLIVVGRGRAGKTSLIRRLNGQPFRDDESETHGITIHKLTFDCEAGPVISRVWDFGGQVVLHSMHEFFLTARSLYLLVLNEREDTRDDTLERDATYWLQLIRSYAGNAPVVVAINQRISKSLGRQRHLDHATLEKNYGPILGWVPTECSDPDPTTSGIADLRKSIVAALNSPHMDSVRRKFPAKWFAIKNDLEAMKESYLDYGSFVKRCEAYGEDNPKEQAALATDLHDLGVALNYGRDARLRDTSVLRPDWLANGIYAVLRANDRDPKLPPGFDVALALDGIVNAESMAPIHAKAEAWGMLSVEDYPPEKQHFLLRLMNLFHLSYPLDDSGQQHLVPTLLSPQPPDGADEPSQPNRICLRYEFPIVPAPLLPWFIARTFSLVPDRLHWRRGTMLVFGDARAKVWTTHDDRHVFVTVAGPDHDQHRLLTIIRGTLESIFQEYRGLRPVEQRQYKGKWVPREILEEFGVLPPSCRPVAEDFDGEVRQ